jgi:hypothetical protein
VHRGQRDFDFELGAGQQVREDVQTDTTTVRAVSLTAQAIPTELLPALLRLLPDARDQQMQFELVTGEGYLVGMRARVVGRERVTVPAGNFDSFKVQLEPTGVLAVLATLRGKLYMWHTVAAPHVWVKYQGPDGSPGVQTVVRELVRFDTPRAPAARPLAAPIGPRTAGLAAPVVRPDGSWSAPPETLAFLLVLLALLFVIGMECGAPVSPAVRVRDAQAKDEG